MAKLFGQVIKKSRRALVRNTISKEELVEDSSSSSEEANKSTKIISDRLSELQNSILESPPKEVKEVTQKLEKELNTFCSPIKRVHKEIFRKETPPVKQLKLSEKLNILKEKEQLEPEGVSFRPINQYANYALDEKDKLILELKKQLNDEKRKCSNLETELNAKPSSMFGIQKFMGEPTDFLFYTGVPDYLTFLTLCDLLEPERHGLNTLYYTKKDNAYVNTRGRCSDLSIKEQIFLTLCRLRQGYMEKDLADRYDITEATVSSIFSKCINHMAHVFRQLPIWASFQTVQDCMAPTICRLLP